MVVLCHARRPAPESRGLRREVVREGFRVRVLEPEVADELPEDARRKEAGSGRAQPGKSRETVAPFFLHPPAACHQLLTASSRAPSIVIAKPVLTHLCGREALVEVDAVTAARLLAAESDERRGRQPPLLDGPDSRGQPRQESTRQRG